MRGLSQVSSAMKSISGGNTWCRSCEVRSSWTCSRNWKKMRLEQRERGGNVAAALTTEEIGTRSQVASETLKMIMDCVSPVNGKPL